MHKKSRKKIKFEIQFNPMAAQEKLLIKNMVCSRCIATVQTIFDTLGIAVSQVALGEVVFKTPVTATQLELVKDKLHHAGFEIIETRVNKIVEDIKRLIAEYLEGIRENKVNLSAYIVSAIPYDYSYLSDLFSSVEGKSIEQFFIVLRIEKVKELLVYDQLSLTEIAFRTGFSSVHHLSAQFKKVTGLTPSYFKSVGAEKRRSIDSL
jgi:YesN/AraC family two-component response regulator